MASREDQPSYWNDAQCESRYGALCKTKVSPSVPEPPVLLNCEDEGHFEFVKFNGACYRWIDTPKTWDDAEQDCINQHSHLVSIVDDMEQAYVFTRVKQSQAWIGLSNKQVRI